MSSPAKYLHNQQNRYGHHAANQPPNACLHLERGYFYLHVGDIFIFQGVDFSVQSTNLSAYPFDFLQYSLFGIFIYDHGILRWDETISRFNALPKQIRSFS